MTWTNEAEDTQDWGDTSPALATFTQRSDGLRGGYWSDDGEWVDSGVWDDSEDWVDG